VGAGAGRQKITGVLQSLSYETCMWPIETPVVDRRFFPRAPAYQAATSARPDLQFEAAGDGPSTPPEMCRPSKS